MNLTTIVGHVGGRCKGKDDEQNAWKNVPAKRRKIKAKIKSHIDAIFGFLDQRNDTRSFDEVRPDFTRVQIFLRRPSRLRNIHRHDALRQNRFCIAEFRL